MPRRRVSSRPSLTDEPRSTRLRQPAGRVPKLAPSAQAGARRRKDGPARGGAPDEGAPEPGARLDDVPVWRYAGRTAVGGSRSGFPARSLLRLLALRGPARLALIPLATAVVAAVAAGLPKVALTLACPVAVAVGRIRPAWTGAGAFVHPGQLVQAPAAGRLLFVAPPGLVAAGAVLATISVAFPTRAAAPARAARRGLATELRWSGPEALPPLPADGVRGLTVGALCLRTRCRASAVSVPAPPVTVRAAAAGWFSPSADPLADLPAAAMGGLTPSAVGPPPPPVAAGAPVSSGTPVGVLGAPWAGVWLVALPERALAPLTAAGAAPAISWPGASGIPATVVGEGADVAGRFVAVLLPDATGPPPGPPSRAQVTVDLPSVAGQVVPASALRSGTVLTLRPSAGARRVPTVTPVRVVALGNRLAVVSGIPSGDLVLAQPEFAAPWAAGTA